MRSLVITEDRHSHNGISRDAFVCHQPGINHCLRLNMPVAEYSWALFAEVDYSGNILRARGKKSNPRDSGNTTKQIGLFMGYFTCLGNVEMQRTAAIKRKEMISLFLRSVAGMEFTGQWKHQQVQTKPIVGVFCVLFLNVLFGWQSARYNCYYYYYYYGR